jgi:hypothetical protein
VFEIRRYAVVEQALARAYDIEPNSLLAFRSRLGALQRGGLFGAERPGKGRKLGYGPDQFHRLLFALELSAWSIAPSLILKMVEEFWNSKLRAIFAAAESAITRPTDGGDIALVIIGGDQMFQSLRDPAALRLTFAPLRELPRCINMVMQDDRPRALVTNLTARLKHFHGALADAHDLTEPVVPTKGGRKARRGRLQRKRRK